MKRIIIAVALFIGQMAMADYSNCYDATTEKNSKALEALGFTKAGSQTFEVQTGSYGEFKYWKETTAYRYIKDQRVSFSTCRGIIESPMPMTGENLVLKGKFFKFKCSNGYDFCLKDQVVPQYTHDGEAKIQLKKFSLDQFGNAFLIVNLDAAASSDSIAPDSEMLFRNGNDWINDDGLISVTIKNDRIVSAIVTTQLVEYPQLSHLLNRSQFQMNPLVMSGMKQVRIVDLPGKTGIKLLPNRIEFESDEGTSIEILNESTFKISGTSSASAPMFWLQPKEKVILKVGIPSFIQLSPFPGSVEKLELKLRD